MHVQRRNGLYAALSFGPGIAFGAIPASFNEMECAHEYRYVRIEMAPPCYV